VSLASKELFTLLNTLSLLVAMTKVLFRGSSCWMSGRGSAPEDSGHGTAPEGSGHGPALSELIKHGDAAHRHTAWFWIGPTWRQGLDWSTLMGPFQLGIFCDLMILWLWRPRHPSHSARWGLQDHCLWPSALTQSHWNFCWYSPFTELWNRLGSQPSPDWKRDTTESFR